MRLKPENYRQAKWVAMWLMLGAIGFLRGFHHVLYFDDEGYFLLTIKQLTEGYPLYEKIQSFYGPFYYIFTSTASGFGRIAVTHDWGRLVTLACWLTGTALGARWVAGRTQSNTWVALSAVLLFAHLHQMGGEPMHPQGLCIVLIFSMITVASSGSPTPARRVALGAIAAALALTKINIGAFAFLGLAWLEAWNLPFDRWRRGFLLTVTAASVGLTFALFGPLMGTTTVQCYAAVFALGMAPVLAHVWEGARVSQCRPQGHGWWWQVAGFAATVVLVYYWTVSKGTSLSALWNGLIVRPSSFAKVFHSPGPFAGPQLLAGAASVLGFVVFQSRRRRAPGKARQMLRALRLIVGGVALSSSLAGVASALTGYHFFIVPAVLETLTKGCLPFLWIGLPWADEEKSGAGAYRAAVLLAFPQLLWAFPVNGTQFVMATTVPLVIWITCLHRATLAADVRFLRWTGKLAAAFVVVTLIGGLAGAARRYMRAAPLCLPGARWVRVEEEDAATLSWAAHNLRAYAPKFVSLPGIPSLNLWSGVQPPTQRNVGPWMLILSAKEQQEIIRSIAGEAEAMVVRHEPALRFWGQQETLTNSVLARLILDQFKPVAKFGSVTLAGRPRAKEKVLVHEATITSLGAGNAPLLKLRFGGDEPREVAEAIFFDVTRRHASGGRLKVRASPDIHPRIETPWEVEVPFPAGSVPEPTHTVVVQLFNARGQRIGTLPLFQKTGSPGVDASHP